MLKSIDTTTTTFLALWHYDLFLSGVKAFLDRTQDESHRNGVCIEMDAFVICLYFRSTYRGIQFCLDMHAIGHNLMSSLRTKHVSVD